MSKARAIAAVALSLLLADAAQAALGRGAESVPRDAAALRGTARARPAAPGVVVHEIFTEDGAQIREYESPSGLVYAMAWEGPSLPDLKVLLGRHYDSYAAQARSGGSTAKVLSISNERLVMRVARLPRGLAGTAYLPGLVPRGTSADDIR